MFKIDEWDGIVNLNVASGESNGLKKHKWKDTEIK
jgi:hypothetical protein